MGKRTLSKDWYKSRLVWSGLLKMFAGLIMSLGQLLAGEMQLDAFITGLVSMAWGLGDVLLRLDTNSPINR